MYNTKGASKDIQKREMKVALSKKIMQEEKKREILQQQYEKSLELMNSIKGYLVTAFESLEIPEATIAELKDAAVTEENMLRYFGILEEKGLATVSEYAKLVAEQIRYEKSDQPEINQQIENLQNIIEYENANLLNANMPNGANQASGNREFPEDLLEKADVVGEDPNHLTQNLSREKLLEYAMGLYNKKMTPLKANPNASVRQENFKKAIKKK